MSVISALRRPRQGTTDNLRMVWTADCVSERKTERRPEGERKGKKMRKKLCFCPLTWILTCWDSQCIR